MKRPRILGLGIGSCVLGFAAVLAAGCGSRDATTDSDVIKVSTRLSPVNFDPRIGTDEGSQRVHELVYSHLLAVNDTLQAAPGHDALAGRLDNPDPVTCIVHLRAGVRFHDGHELTSKDVVYTFGSFLDPDFVLATKAAYQMLESVKALDAYTVEFKLKAPFGSFPAQLVMHIVPDGAGDSLRSFPIGTGPYRFVRYVVDEQVELSAYEGYWDGLPQNAGVVLRIMPDDTMRGLELRKGSADGAARRFQSHVLQQSEGRSADRSGDHGDDRRGATDALQRRTEVVAEDAPYISLWYKTNIAVARPNITGMRLSAQSDFLALKDVRRGK